MVGDYMDVCDRAGYTWLKKTWELLNVRGNRSNSVQDRRRLCCTMRSLLEYSYFITNKVPSGITSSLLKSSRTSRYCQQQIYSDVSHPPKGCWNNNTAQPSLSVTVYQNPTLVPKLSWASQNHRDYKNHSTDSTEHLAEHTAASFFSLMRQRAMLLLFGAGNQVAMCGK